MEGDSLFPVLRLKPSDPPPFRHPRESGIALRPECKRIRFFEQICGGHSDKFCAFKPKHALFFVIPAKAGIQIRDDPVDCVSRGFFRCFPVRPPLDPRFAGMTERGKSRESWAEVREKGATPDRDRKYGPISELPEVCKRLYSIELTKKVPLCLPTDSFEEARIIQNSNLALLPFTPYFCKRLRLENFRFATRFRSLVAAGLMMVSSDFVSLRGSFLSGAFWRTEPPSGY
jgi:hypothetical protein